MSTRTSMALATIDQVEVHLYRELHDGCAHLELRIDHTNVLLNIVIPEPMIDGLARLIRQSE